MALCGAGANSVDVAFIQGVFLQDNFPKLNDFNKRKQVRSLQIGQLEDFDEGMFTELLKEAAGFLSKSKKPGLFNNYK